MTQPHTNAAPHSDALEIFLIATPGLAKPLRDEAVAQALADMDKVQNAASGGDHIDEAVERSREVSLPPGTPVQ